MKMLGTFLCSIIINPRRTCAARVIVVVVRVCQSVLLARHLTSRAINRSTNNTMHSALGIGRKICRVFFEATVYGVKRERSFAPQTLTHPVSVSGFMLYKGTL